jgi:GT2 family glycosyltransferase
MESTNNEILISLLTYNSSDFIKQCLDSLRLQSNQNFKCFVIDNNSNDNIAEVLKKYPEVTFIKREVNDGYTGGHNFALNFFIENFPNHQYMMVLNPDTILSPNLIEIYQSNFYKKSDFYTCAIKNLDSDTFFYSGYVHLPSFTFLAKKTQNKENSEIKYSNFLNGACFIFNFKKYKNDFLFRNYFMYHDEIELSLRIRINNQKIMHCEGGYITHFTKKASDLSEKTIYLLELNRLKLQTDVFSNLFILLNLPFYILSRLLILFIYKPLSHYKTSILGILDGMIYLFKNFNKNQASFFRTIKFFIYEN